MYVEKKTTKTSHEPTLELEFSVKNRTLALYHCFNRDIYATGVEAQVDKARFNAELGAIFFRHRWLEEFEYFGNIWWTVKI